jgi:hypothetical protein
MNAAVRACSLGGTDTVFIGGGYLSWKATLSLWRSANSVLEVLDIESPIFASQLRICLNAFLVVSFMKRIGMVQGGLHYVGGNFEERHHGRDQFFVAQGDAGSICGKVNRFGL